MKSTHLALLTLLNLAVASFTSCSSSSDIRLKAMVEDADKNCPTEITSGFTLESVSDDGAYVIYRYVYVDSLYNPRANCERYGEEAVKATSIRSIADSPMAPEFFSTLTDASRGLKYIYVGAPSGETYTLTLTADEVKAAAPGPQKQAIGSNQ